jgi:diketogulonate reductase-like aldo/keto reductase
MTGAGYGPAVLNGISTSYEPEDIYAGALWGALQALALHRAFEISLRELRLDYVDLYMIHWPSQDMDMVATLEALMELREHGLTRAIGVCNFNQP